MEIKSKMTRDEAEDIADKIIHAGWEADKRHAEKYNLDLEESLSTGRRQRARLLRFLKESFEVEDC
jgi:hypothetical protein